MCGFLSCFGEKPPDALLHQGLQALAPRGPDDKGIYEDSLAWMGFRRLSILDLSHLGHQPMLFDNGRYILVFNGEIYNYRELRSTYLQGVDIQSSGDTETLGHLLQFIPVEKLLPKLRGMFAFVWYDKYARKVIAVRDHFGIKPLYYHKGTNQLYLSSELKALLKLDITRELNLQGVRDFLGYGSVQSPHTIMKEVDLLPSGHMLSWEADAGIQVKEWHTPQWRRKDEWIGRDKTQLMEITREIFLETIKAHLLSDVEVGVFLSSGIDSSLIACGMKYLGQQKIKAFSIGYETTNGGADESLVAKKTAAFLGADFESEIVTGESVLTIFEDYIRAMDQPTGDALNTYLVSRLASRSVKVAMSGVGIDEWLGGYNFYKIIKASHLLRRMGVPLAECASIAEVILRNYRVGKNADGDWKIMHLCKLAKLPNMREMQNAERTFFKQTDFRGSPLLQDVTADPPFFDLQELEKVAPDSVINKLFALETKTYLRNTLIRDSDWTSMAHSLELRTPFIDTEAFNVLAIINPDQKLRYLGNKRLLRECFADILPPWILDEKRKRTFTLPKSLWMKEPGWSERIKMTLLDPSFTNRGLIRTEVVQRYLNSFYLEKDANARSYHLSQKIWMLFVLEEWLRAHVDS